MARELAGRYDPTIEWTVAGDRTPHGTVADTVAAVGVLLPPRMIN